MPRYIDADVFEKWLKEFYPSRLEIISGIRNTPTVDAAPVVHAHKGTHVGDKYYCSNCGHLVYCAKYCEICGAKMDGEQCVRG